MVLPTCRALVDLAFRHGAGEGGMLLRPWHNHWRDLKLVHEELKIDPFSLHSLRHTFATWQLAAGMPFDDVARALGQSDTTMLHKVYGHLSAEELRDRMARYIPATGASGDAPSPNGPRHAAEGADNAVTAESEKAPFPSGNEASSRYRRSELNQRPWDYDSERLADVIPLVSPGNLNRRALRKETPSPNGPRALAKGGRG